MGMYPKKMYKSVLLLDGKIINWKITSTAWETVDEAFCNRQPVWVADRSNLSVCSMCAIVNNTKENNEFFACKDWFRQYDIHENFSENMFRPY